MLCAHASFNPVGLKPRRGTGLNRGRTGQSAREARHVARNIYFACSPEGTDLNFSAFRLSIRTPKVLRTFDESFPSLHMRAKYIFRARKAGHGRAAGGGASLGHVRKIYISRARGASAWAGPAGEGPGRARAWAVVACRGPGAWAECGRVRPPRARRGHEGARGRPW